jgi:hypothetical protein
MSFETSVTDLSELEFDLGELAEQIKNASVTDEMLIAQIKSKIVNLQIPPDEIKLMGISLEKSLLKRVLEAKQKKFENSRDLSANYIRVDVLENPALPIQALLEIWPKNHFSTIHAHGGSVGVIKALYGSVKIELFESLQNPSMLEFFKLQQGEITHLTSTNRCVHRLWQQGLVTPFTLTLQVYCRPQKKEFEFLDKNKNVAAVIPQPDLGYSRLLENIY